MTTESIRVVAESPARTAAVAAAVAGQLRAGDVVLLHGELAAGKTTFVAAAAAALGSPDQVTSPTFMLAQFYAGGRVPVLHVDTSGWPGWPSSATSGWRSSWPSR